MVHYGYIKDIMSNVLTLLASFFETPSVSISNFESHGPLRLPRADPLPALWVALSLLSAFENELQREAIPEVSC